MTTVPSLAGAYPLFVGLATPEQAAACASVLGKDFLQPGGLVSTLNKTGQQWDAPNGWAPLQWVAISGLRRYGHAALADVVADRWIALNERVFRSTGRMMEKYNVVDMTLDAGGGEYPVQDGFGWSNGVLLRLLSDKK
jgi:alpha,alpha-trehalase